jgi:hypothetical protein
VCGPTILQIHICSTFMKGFQKPFKKLDKGDVCVSISFWKYLQSFTSLFKTLFNHLQGMILIEH